MAFEEFKTCEKCRLSTVRSKVVLGVGSVPADIMLLGEAPGADEDLYGKPFCGRAGKILKDVIQFIDLNVNNVYITNTCLCWTGTGNRNPSAEEILACRENLVKQILTVRPKYIVPLGNVPLEAITGKKEITKRRGKFVHLLPDIENALNPPTDEPTERYIPKVYPTFHPAYILRNQNKKVYLIKDLAYIDGLVNEKENNLEHVLVDTTEKFDAMSADVLKHKIGAVDVETTGLSYKKDYVIGISFSVSWNKGYYVPLWYRKDDDIHNPLESFWGVQDQDYVRSGIEEILKFPKLQKVGQGFDFDRKMILHDFGCEVSNVVFDTLYGAHLVDENCKHDLDTLALRYPDLLNYKKKLEVELTKKSIEGKDFTKASLDTLVTYGAGDAIATFRSAKDIFKSMKGTKLEDIMFGISMPLSEVVHSMQTRGVKIDVKYLRSLKKKFGNELEYLEKEIYRIAGEKFNINSTDQLRTILFRKLKLKSKKKSKKTDKLSTDKNVLKSLIKQHEIIPALLKYRGVHKLYSTYVVGIENRLIDGILYPSFGVTGTVTGRLNSSDPNLQNISKASDDEHQLGLGEYQAMIRPMFIPREGNLFLPFDYSQIEVRILAWYCQDEKLIKALEAGSDIHYNTAKDIFGNVEITDERRRAAKTINFGVIYGLSPKSLAERLGLTEREANEFINTYFMTYPKIRPWIFSVHKQLRQNLYVENIFGRRRRFPQYPKLQHDWQRRSAQRMAVNFMVQSTASDVVKLSQIRCFKELPKAHQVAQVHDEIIFEVKEDEAQEYYGKITEIMERPMKPITVHLPVDGKIQSRWGVNYEGDDE